MIISFFFLINIFFSISQIGLTRLSQMFCEILVTCGIIRIDSDTFAEIVNVTNHTTL